MKSREWAAQFNQAFQGKGDVFALMEQFAIEAKDLIEQRTKFSRTADFLRSATEGAVRQAKQKWAAVQRCCPKLKPFTFDQVAKQIRAVASAKTEKYIAA